MPTSFLDEVVQRVAFLLKYAHLFMPQCYEYEALKKQHCGRGGTNKWRQTPFAVIAKQAHDKKESLHVQITRARLSLVPNLHHNYRRLQYK